MKKPRFKQIDLCDSILEIEKEAMLINKPDKISLKQLSILLRSHDLQTAINLSKSNYQSPKI